MIIARLHMDLLAFSIIFSVIFCLVCSLVDSLLGFWVFLELAGMSIIPSFFYGVDSSFGSFYNSLLTYVIMSSLSSVFLFTGIMIVNLYHFIFLGFVVKFGLFPFSFWVYKIFMGSNWLFIFFLSVVMKFPIIFFCYLYQGFSLFFVCVDSFITIMLCAFLFWVVSLSWEFIWGHISIVSVATLMVACFYSDASISFFVYFYYFIWGSLCLWYFSQLSSGVVNFWVFFFLLLVTPVSLPLFYKLSVSLSILYSYIFLLLMWCLYNFSEQFFLFKLVGDNFYSSVYNVWHF